MTRRGEVEIWPPANFDARLVDRARIVVLFGGPRCSLSRAFLPIFETAEPDANVPFAHAVVRARGDARRKRYRIEVTPTLVYFEHGEELERCEGIPAHGLSKRDLEELLSLVDGLEEEPRTPKWMHGIRRT
jgi:hypothetical protein